MEKRKLGRTGLEVSALGFGGAEIGFEKAEQAAVDRLLNAALDAGLNVIDTAAAYPESEQKIAAAVGSRRGEFFLFTKCGNSMSSDPQYWTADVLARTIDQSLKDLNTDRVDLIQLHSPNVEILKKGEAIEALQKARAAGKARFIGCSADNDAAVYAVECGAFDTLQTSINIADQSVIDDVLPKAHAAGMGVIAKRPIANAAWKTGVRPASPYHHVYWERVQKLRYDFLRQDLEQSISLALRFTLSQEGVATAIVGTKNPERWAQNAKLLESGSLGPQMVEQIRSRWKEAAQSTWVGQT